MPRTTELYIIFFESLREGLQGLLDNPELKEVAKDALEDYTYRHNLQNISKEYERLRGITKHRFEILNGIFANAYRELEAGKI